MNSLYDMYWVLAIQLNEWWIFSSLCLSICSNICTQTSGSKPFCQKNIWTTRSIKQTSGLWADCWWFVFIVHTFAEYADIVSRICYLLGWLWLCLFFFFCEACGFVWMFVHQSSYAQHVTFIVRYAHRTWSFFFSSSRLWQLTVFCVDRDQLSVDDHFWNEIYLCLFIIIVVVVAAVWSLPSSSACSDFE